METIEISYKGISSKNANFFYIKCDKEVNGFFVSKMIRVTEAKYAELNIGDIIEVPAECLR